MAKKKKTYDPTKGGLCPGSIEGGGVRFEADAEGKPVLRLLASGRSIDLEALADQLGSEPAGAEEPGPEPEPDPEIPDDPASGE